MRNALIVIIIIILGAGGFLGWDWYDKTQKRKLEPSITLYYWTDADGNVFSRNHYYQYSLDPEISTQPKYPITLTVENQWGRKISTTITQEPPCY